MEDEGRQDLGTQKQAVPDKGWARTQPVQMVPSSGRLNMEHGTYDFTNTGVQKHIIVDRHLTGHEIEPGQTIHGIEMVNDEVKYFMRQRDDHRRDRFGQKLPKHPIMVKDAEPRDEDDERPMNTRPLHERLGRPGGARPEEDEHEHEGHDEHEEHGGADAEGHGHKRRRPRARH